MKPETKIFWSAMRIVYDIVFAIAAVVVIIGVSIQLISKELTQPDKICMVLGLIAMPLCAVYNIKAIPEDIQKFKDRVKGITEEEKE